MENQLIPSGGIPPQPQQEGAPQALMMGADAPPEAGAGRIAPDQIDAAHSQIKVVSEGLMGLASRPKGSLSKRDLYNAVGEMIAQGAFSTPEAKQQLLAQLSEIPDDEKAIRQAIGERLIRMGDFHQRFLQHIGQADA